LGPITPDRIGLWRQELSEDEILALERLGRNALESLGYALTMARGCTLSAGFYARLCWNLFGLAWRLPWRAKTNELLERLTRSPFSVSTMTRTVKSAATMWSPGTELNNGKGETAGVL